MAAKKDETVSMFDSFKEFKETKNIDRTTLVSVLEESFRNVLAKIFGSDENFDVIVNPDKGDFEIYRNRVVVADGEVEDENKQISLKEARKIEADYEVGEDVSEKVEFAKFGRRAILNLRQTLASKILELEHDLGNFLFIWRGSSPYSLTFPSFSTSWKPLLLRLCPLDSTARLRNPQSSLRSKVRRIISV